MSNLTYNPAIFDQSTLENARRIILTPEGSTSDSRWAKETPYVCALIGRHIKITTETLILDFGCGIGRVAKELITQHGCHVVGVDISAKMREMAVAYVDSDRFSVCAPQMLKEFVGRGLRFNAAISIWVLQHVHNLRSEIDLLRAALKPAADIFVLNNTNRAVPTRELSWVNDLVDVKRAMQETFVTKQEGTLPTDIVAPQLLTCHYWALFAKRLKENSKPDRSLVQHSDLMAQTLDQQTDE